LEKVVTKSVSKQIVFHRPSKSTEAAAEGIILRVRVPISSARPTVVHARSAGPK
jgi:hypothetical protein